MSERQVTAVVLLSRSTTAATLDSITGALQAQARTPDGLLIVAPADLPEELRGCVREAADRLQAQDVLSISGSVSRAGAVREVLEQLALGRDRHHLDASGSEHSPADHPAPSRDAAEPEGKAAEPEGRAAEPDREDTDREDSRSAPAPGSSEDDVALRGSRGRRRARAVDLDALERRRTQEAESLAQVPVRLRRKQRRSGRRAEAGGDSWLWILTDETAPGHEALEHLMATVALSPSTSVVGPKRVRFEDDEIPADLPEPSERPDPSDPSDLSVPSARPRPTADDADVLVDVGLTLTHSGRIVTGVDPGEIDQGQSDWRQDVLAVALPGMLVRERTLRETGSLDPDLPSPWAEIDLCRRVWLNGERVAVQSRSRVLAPRNPVVEGGQDEELRRRRTGQILMLLKHRSTGMGLLTLLLLPLVTVLRMAGAIAASVPRQALVELRAGAAALRRGPRMLRRGLGERHRARVPSGRLAPLYLPRGEGVRQGIDTAWTHLFADDERTRRIRLTSWGIAGTRHGIDDADYGRHVVWTVVLALTSTALGLLVLRGLFGRGELTGPALLPMPDSWAVSRQAAWSTWIPGGLGERGPGDPLVRLLGHLPVGGNMLVEAVVFGAIPASAVAAWWASGAITRAVGARLTLAVAWALAPPLLAALTDGAWPLLLVHLLLPVLALAIGHAVGLPSKESLASVPAAAAAGLVLLVIGAVMPVLVVLAAVAVALIALTVPGRRSRLLWVLIPSLALHAPYLPVLLGDPALLLGVGGVQPRTGTAGTEDLLALWPTAPGARTVLEAQVGQFGAQLLLMLPLLPVIAGALIAPWLAGQAGRAGRFAVVFGGAALLSVLIARGTPVAAADGQLVAPPLHALLSCLLLALCVGGAATFDALARREGGISRTRRLVTAGAGAVVAVACAAAVVGWTMLLPTTLAVDRVEGGQVPAAAADQGRTDSRSRVLVLQGEQDGAVRADVVVHGEDSVVQHATIASIRDVDTVRSGAEVDADPGSVALRTAVTRILSPDTDGSDQDVASLAIAYVIVPGDPEADAELVGRLDASSAVEKVTQNATGSMWRVIDTAPRAWIDGGSVNGDAPQPLSSDVISAHGEITPAEGDRTVVLSERYDTQWRATVDGTQLEATRVDDWAQGFVLPAGAEGRIDIVRSQPLTPLWKGVLYGSLLLTALIAVPWRARSRAAEVHRA